MPIRIGELAKMADCPVATIRFMKKGLLDAPERNGGNYRLYDEKALQQLRFILHCRKHGIKLQEIRKLLVLRANPERNSAFAHELIKKHIQEVDAQLESLTNLRRELLCLDSANACGNQGHCSILQKLDDSDSCHLCRDLAAREAANEAAWGH